MPSGTRKKTANKGPRPTRKPTSKATAKKTRVSRPEDNMTTEQKESYLEQKRDEARTVAGEAVNSDAGVTRAKNVAEELKRLSKSLNVTKTNHNVMLEGDNLLVTGTTNNAKQFTRRQKTAAAAKSKRRKGGSDDESDDDDESSASEESAGGAGRGDDDYDTTYRSLSRSPQRTPQRTPPARSRPPPPAPPPPPFRLRPANSPEPPTPPRQRTPITPVELRSGDDNDFFGDGGGGGAGDADQSLYNPNFNWDQIGDIFRDRNADDQKQGSFENLPGLPGLANTDMRAPVNENNPPGRGEQNEQDEEGERPPDPAAPGAPAEEEPDEEKHERVEQNEQNPPGRGEQNEQDGEGEEEEEKGAIDLREDEDAQEQEDGACNNNGAGGGNGAFADGSEQNGVVLPSGNMRGQFGYNKFSGQNDANGGGAGGGGPGPFTSGFKKFDKSVGDELLDVHTKTDASMATLRPLFGMEKAGTVIPSPEEQIKSDLRFDMFDTVSPGFGLGDDNVMFIMEQNRQKKIIHANAMSTPGSYIGPEAGVGVTTWKLQREIPAKKIQKYQNRLSTQVNSIVDLVRTPNRAESTNVLGDDIGLNREYSSKSLKRNRNSVLQPVISTEMEFTSSRIPTGFELSQYKMRRLTDSMRYPRHLQSNTNGMGGPTSNNRRSLSVILQ
jgi:hypothetical protein